MCIYISSLKQYIYIFYHRFSFSNDHSYHSRLAKGQRSPGLLEVIRDATPGDLFSKKWTLHLFHKDGSKNAGLTGFLTMFRCGNGYRNGFFNGWTWIQLAAGFREDLRTP